MTGKIKRIIQTENGDNYVADIENIENRITQNSSNLETAKQELSNKCNEALIEAKAYTDQEKAKYLPLTGDLVKNSYVDSSDNTGVFCLKKETGAMLYLFDVNSANFMGGAILRTVDKDTQYKDLQIKNNGSFTWCGLNIVRSVNGALADDNGNVSVVGAITGEIKWFAFNTVPDGYIICNGAKVSRTTYANLFAAIGTAFGSGDGSTTFDLPDLVDKFAEGSRTVGTYKGPGLPNITGEVGYISAHNYIVDNHNIFSNQAIDWADYRQVSSTLAENANSHYIATGLKIDASRSNSIYGNSTTVQPLALTLLPCIKY